jgi:hypothetical protein
MFSRIVLACLAVSGAALSSARASDVTGDYLEVRTCSVYTGPCFANAESGLTGREAVMAWSIDEGQYNGVDLAGRKVIVSLAASGTLAFGGGVEVHAFPVKSVILVDEQADSRQRDALVAFAKEKAGQLAGDVVRVETVPIDMQLDHVDMVASLNAGDKVKIATRKLKDGDCVCTNEIVYYPPLAKVENYAPAFTLEGAYHGGGLGVKWSTPDTRSAFLATF